MAATGLKERDIVRHWTHGIGRVKAVDGDAIVIDFRGRPDQRMSKSIARNLDTLPEDCLAALIWDGPETVREWHEEAPLKLLAAALADIGGTGKAGEIRERLDHGSLLGEKKWDAWWPRVRAVAADSSHFRTIRNKSNAVMSVRLVSRASDVPSEPLPPPPPKTDPQGAASTKKVSLADWRNWLRSETFGVPPGRSPTKPVCGALAKWPHKTIKQALERAMEGAEEFLSAGGTPRLAAAGWLNAVSIASQRWRDSLIGDGGSDRAGGVGNLLIRLAGAAGYSEESTKILLQAGELTGHLDSWRREFMAGAWTVLRDSGDDARGLVRETSVQMGHRGQRALVTEIVLAALRADDSASRHSALDHLLETLPGVGGVHSIRELMVRSVAGEAPHEDVLDYVANSRFGCMSAAPDQRMGTMLLATLLLTDGQSRVAGETSRELAEAFTSVGDGVVQSVFKDVRAANQEWRENMRAESRAKLESQRQDYEARLDRERREQERLRQQNRTFRAQMASGREESRLEVRQDMLLAVGDVLERAHLPGRTVEERLQAVMSALPNVLQAGDAAAFGTPGETVPFNPRLYYSSDTVPDGAPVRVLAPGVVVRGESSGERMVLKASVARQSESDTEIG